MSEIVLGDLVTWPEVGLRTAGSPLRTAVASQPVSWAVNVGHGTPALPALRGDEIVAISSSTLASLESTGGATLRQLFDLLVEQPISAVILDHVPHIPVPEGITPLIGDPSFVVDAEAILNREITRRRADLYRLGAGLARTLSSATLAGSDLDGFLTAAAEVSGMPMALVTARGTMLGRSTDAPAFLPDSIIERNLEDTGYRSPVRMQVDRRIWLLVSIESRVLPDGVRLVLDAGEGASAELARLTIQQTADALQLLFDRSGPPAIDKRDERERALRELLLGRLSPDDRRSVAIFNGFDLQRGARAFFLWGVDDGDLDRLRAAPEVLVAPIGRSDAVGVVGTGYDFHELGGMLGVVSAPITTLHDLPGAISQTRQYESLARTDLVGGRIIALDDQIALGFHGLLFALMHDGSAGSTNLAGFVDAHLGMLRSHDNDRQSDLLVSLRAYLDHGAALGQAADALAVHRNTLSYRLNRIRELSGYDLDDPSQRFRLQVAFRIQELLDAFREDIAT
ncbi:MAG: PucR family transcriptional regulator [Chloroflexota bacterium]